MKSVNWVGFRLFSSFSILFFVFNYRYHHHHYYLRLFFWFLPFYIDADAILFVWVPVPACGHGNVVVRDRWSKVRDLKWESAKDKISVSHSEDNRPLRILIDWILDTHPKNTGKVFFHLFIYCFIMYICKSITWVLVLVTVAIVCYRFVLFRSFDFYLIKNK